MQTGSSWIQPKLKFEISPAMPLHVLNLTYADHLLLGVEIIKFLGLQLDNQTTWKNHIQILLRNKE
jgi:hypothetical protein